jgi:hypothetical protein
MHERKLKGGLAFMLDITIFLVAYGIVQSIPGISDTFVFIIALIVLFLTLLLLRKLGLNLLGF